MSRHYPIWVEINSCIYSSCPTKKTGNKSYGARNETTQKIKVGRSRLNSHHFATVQIKRTEQENGEVLFELMVDDVIIKQGFYDPEQSTLVRVWGSAQLKEGDE